MLIAVKLIAIWFAASIALGLVIGSWLKRRDEQAAAVSFNSDIV